MTPLAHERNSIFKCKHHTTHYLRGPEEYNCTMMFQMKCVMANGKRSERTLLTLTSLNHQKLIKQCSDYDC